MAKPVGDALKNVTYYSELAKTLSKQKLLKRQILDTEKYFHSI